MKLIPAIPKLHKPMHGHKNHDQYSLNFIPGVGKLDMEMLERVWVGHNALGNSTKTQGPGGRHDILDDHFSFWNWQKYIGMGKTRGFQNFNGTPGVEFFILLGFAEPTTHVIQAHFHIR